MTLQQLLSRILPWRRRRAANKRRLTRLLREQGITWTLTKRVVSAYFNPRKERHHGSQEGQ